MKKHIEIRQKATLARLERFSRFTDSSIGIPYTNWQIGADSVIGLLPVVGDIVGLVMSSYVLFEAQRVGASKGVKLRMLRNVAIDFFGGLLPVVGDAFDAIYKANTRNTRLLKYFIEEELEAELEVATPPQVFPWKALIGLSIIFAVITGGLTLIF